MEKGKKGEFSFEWLFALIAGGAILVLAVYGAMHIGNTQKYQTDTEVAKKIAILTDPLQAGFASGSLGKITFQQETRIYNDCLAGEFGANRISVSTKSGIGEKWSLPGGEISVNNKYIFSKTEEGKVYYVLSKPFNFPYKVADLIFITSENYCFVNPPDAIKEDLESFRAPNIRVDNCSEGDTKVCFSGSCDILIQSSCPGCVDGYEEGYVQKDGMKINYVGSLIYGAIFSDKGVYDCNVKRLFYRDSTIAGLFAAKADLMNARGCTTNMQPELISWAGLTKNAGTNNILSLKDISKNMEDKNDLELCKIW